MSKRSSLIAGFMLLPALAVIQVMAATNYVADIGGSDTNDGSSWAQAFKTISNGVAQTAPGGLVMVSNGTYTLTTNIDIEKGITVMAASTNPADTIIDGNHVTRCFYLGNGNAVISGFKIVNGNAGGEYSGKGGAIFIRYGGLVTNCVISSNNASDAGGGVYQLYTSRLRNCLIANNTAITDGGGVRMVCNDGNIGIVQDCTISSNTAGGSGGGAYLQGNEALYPNTCVISNCTIINNQAAAWGGGLCFQDGLARNCLIQCNSNSGSYGGGAAFIGAGTLTDSRLLDNYVYYGGGGAMLNGGGTLRNCLLQGNYCGYYGGGVFGNAMATYATIGSCTVVSNSAQTGGGINLSGATDTNSIYNCIFYQNVARSGNPTYNEFYFDTASDTNAFSFCSAPYSSLYPLPPDRGNLTNDPAFVDINAGNYRLQRGSPCVNTGSNQSWMANATDLDGRARSDRFSGRVDMGAYEYLPRGIVFAVK